MASREIHSWTLGGLVGAFIDLVLAYFLLCVSAVAFFASKFLLLFGLYLPCPCKGVLGYKNGDFCLHKVLYEWPLRNICSVQVMALKRFPYDLVRVKDHTSSLSEKMTAQKISGNEVRDLEDEASGSSWSSSHLLAAVDRENGYDTKGKKIVNLRRRSGIRRRRKGNNECGKFPSGLPSENPRSDVTLVSSLPYGGDVVGSKTTEMNPTSGGEVSLLDVKDAHMDQDMEERLCHSYEFGGSLVDSPPQDKSSSSTEVFMSNGQDKMQVVESSESRIKILEAALAEERAAYAALCLELEKERSAAATAADEAMAMISRLQEEKAFIEIETRQYQRMIEERVAYEEEEMNILQEILIRREKENHFLEKELEAYRQMNLRVTEQPNGKPLDDLGQRPSFSVETHESHLQTDSSISMAKISHLQSNHTVDQTCIRINDGEEVKKNRQLKDQYHGNLLSSFLDTEPDVLDVHVIDDNIELKKEEVEKTNGFSFNTASDEPRDNDLTSASLEVLNSIALSNFHRASKAESDDGADANINEKLKIGTEIEMLGERLRMLKHEKEKLTFFPENEESKKVHMKLLEEIANHLQEIKQLRNPVRGSSLPPSSAKVSLKKRRSQSATWKTCESS